jgi:hypothetical protein
LVWYGQVLAKSTGGNVRVTTGTLEWQIEPLSGGAPWVISTTLTNLNDQFSFVLRVPCETPEPAGPATPGTLVLTSPATAYRRVRVTLDGQPLAITSGAAQFSPALADRGRSERIDLVLGADLLDSDGDGLADAWEQQHFGTLNAQPGDDPDGDGMTNLQEYRSGTDPKNPQSLLEFVEIRPQSGGIKLRWSSQPEKTYRVLRSASLLAPSSQYQVIQSGLAATPPFNECLDSPGGSGAQFFYLIQIEE